MQKVVLVPVSNNRVEDLKLTLWSISHVKNISICIIGHKLSPTNKKKLNSLSRNNCLIIYDEKSNNLSDVLNFAQTKFLKSVIFYRLDSGDVVHRERFKILPDRDNILIAHSGVLKYKNKFIIKRYKGFYMHLVRNFLIHSSFIFIRANYSNKYKLAQDYNLSLKKILNKDFKFVNKILVCKPFSIYSNTILKKNLGIQSVIKTKKENRYKKFPIIYLSIIIDKIKLLIWKLNH